MYACEKKFNRKLVHISVQKRRANVSRRHDYLKLDACILIKNKGVVFILMIDFYCAKHVKILSGHPFFFGTSNYVTPILHGYKYETFHIFTINRLIINELSASTHCG
jgi:hypothetical protein